MAAITFRGCGYEAPDGFYFDDELEIRERFWHVKPGDYVVDIGACYGLYTLPALAVGADVLAIDAADARSHSVFPATLEDAAERNGFADRLETRRLALYDGSPYPASLRAQGSTDFDEPTWSTLDDEVAGGRPVDWIKIDVEGAELGVLRGGVRTLREHHPNLVVEDHSAVYPWVVEHRITDQIVQCLQDLDYTIELVPYQGSGGYRDYVIATCAGKS